MPDYFVESVDLIDFKKLKGTKLVLFDLDATLVEHGAIKIDDKTITLIKGLSVPVGIATNRIAPKGNQIAELLGVEHIFHATKRYRKPSKHYFHKILVKTGLRADQVVMVGDRLFSDIYGANRSGLKSIMVRNIGSDPWYIKYFQIRNLEYLMLRFFAKIK